MLHWEKNNHRQKWTDQQVEAHWDRVASIYIQENNKVKGTHDQRFMEMIMHLKLVPNLNILNLTSRDCEADDYIKKEAPDAKVTNAEISSGLMQEAQKVRPWVKQVKLETYSYLPFKNETFDRIVTLETLEHVADPIRFLTELHRVSKPNVRMVLSCPPATSEIPYQVFTRLFGGHGEGPHRFKKTGWKLLLNKGTVLFPVGPKKFQELGERIISRLQKTFVSELGIRQFYVCEKY
jgi:ubiquinone/menaquinone biosynthesis C-methylase UbiE